jgi:membrane protein implicated in regulation of membrane protease activity
MERDMLSTIVSLGIWNWFIAGLVLLCLEIIAPGAFMMWLGLAALLVGVISLMIDWPWQAQLVAFAVFAIASIPLWRRFIRGNQQAVDQPFLNRRNDAMVGRVFTLETPIVDGVGTVRVGDTVWRVNGPDTPAGSRVTVTRADAAMLFVAPAAG